MSLLLDYIAPKIINEKAEFKIIIYCMTSKILALESLMFLKTKSVSAVNKQCITIVGFFFPPIFLEFFSRSQISGFFVMFSSCWIFFKNKIQTQKSYVNLSAFQ